MLVRPLGKLLLVVLLMRFRPRFRQARVESRGRASLLPHVDDAADALSVVHVLCEERKREERGGVSKRKKGGEEKEEDAPKPFEISVSEVRCVT